MNKVKDLKNRQIILINDQNVFISKNNKKRPFLIIKINKHYKEAICCKLSSQKPKHQPCLKLSRKIQNNRIISYVWIFQLYTIKYYQTIKKFEKISIIDYQSIMNKLQLYLFKNDREPELI